FIYHIFYLFYPDHSCGIMTIPEKIRKRKSKKSLNVFTFITIPKSNPKKHKEVPHEASQTKGP
ncbi:MAG TPA: hypothetical protein VN366_01160, partial [Feifaniaceae bacterium]|nr:hypothetical protein [Feifaniaceae bacterium]